MSEFIRSFDHPVLFDSRTLRVRPITLRAPIGWRKLAWEIRRHPCLWRRARHLELVLPIKSADSTFVAFNLGKCHSQQALQLSKVQIVHSLRVLHAELEAAL